jgi:hypothetical protein
MKRSSATPVKTMDGNDSYATIQDQFAAERYIRYNSDPEAPHSATTGIVEMALRYQTICSSRHIIQSRPSKRLLSR